MSSAGDNAPFVRRLVPILCAIAGFATTIAAVRQEVRWPEEYGLRAKVEWYEAHANEFDAIFLGSSRVFRSIDPTVLDPAMEAHGVTWRSANLGVGGMTAYEIDHLLRTILAHKSDRLKWIVLEGIPWRPSDYFFENTYSTRSVNWHDLEGTRRAIRAVFLAQGSPYAKFADAWTHLELAGLKLLTVGVGPRVVQNLLGDASDPMKRAMTPAELDRRRGYQSLDESTDAEFQPWRKTLLENPQAFADHVARIAGENEEPPDLEHYDVEATLAQRREVAAAGAHLVVLLAPALEGSPIQRELHRLGFLPDLVDFNDVQRFPQFFDASLRFDEQHLNAAGAAELSRLVAGELAPIVQRARAR